MIASSLRHIGIPLQQGKQTVMVIAADEVPHAFVCSENFLRDSTDDCRWQSIRD
jgi:hypothetical protein